MYGNSWGASKVYNQGGVFPLCFGVGSWLVTGDSFMLATGFMSIGASLGSCVDESRVGLTGDGGAREDCGACGYCAICCILASASSAGRGR